jgi:DNA-binding transcriptional MerR regulator
VTSQSPDRLLTIGELARESGLTVSALRFYDREGVLVPADVDPVTGYRRYAPAQVREARLVAGLRRVGMPLSEVALVLEQSQRGEGGAAADIVTAHAARLEAGLRDARREIRRTLSLLAVAPGAVTPTVLVAADDLRAAFESVRFAVGGLAPIGGRVNRDPPELSVLSGVLLEVHAGGLRLVATDRYRLAVGQAPGSVTGLDEYERLGRVVPLHWLAEVYAAARGAVSITLEEARVVAEVAGQRLETACVPGEFPDYRRIVDPAAAPRAEALPVGTDLLGGLRGAGPKPVGLPVGTGGVRLTPDGETADVLVNGEFLLQALRAVEGPATLVLDGPVTPLAIRGADGGLSVLMPVRDEAGDRR